MSHMSMTNEETAHECSSLCQCPTSWIQNNTCLGPRVFFVPVLCVPLSHLSDSAAPVRHCLRVAVMHMILKQMTTTIGDNDDSDDNNCLVDGQCLNSEFMGLWGWQSHPVSIYHLC